MSKINKKTPRTRNCQKFPRRTTGFVPPSSTHDRMTLPSPLTHVRTTLPSSNTLWHKPTLDRCYRDTMQSRTLAIVTPPSPQIVFWFLEKFPTFQKLSFSHFLEKHKTHSFDRNQEDWPKSHLPKHSSKISQFHNLLITIISLITEITNIIFHHNSYQHVLQQDIFIINNKLLTIWSLPQILFSHHGNIQKQKKNWSMSMGFFPNRIWPSILKNYRKLKKVQKSSMEMMEG